TVSSFIYFFFCVSSFFFSFSLFFFFFFFFFFFKQKTAYEIVRRLEFRRVLFRSSPSWCTPMSTNAPNAATLVTTPSSTMPGERRSEERRVGKECRSGWWPDH